MFAVAALLLALPLLLGGCATLVLLPKAIDQMTEGPSDPTGFEYHRHDGETSTGEAFRIRHFLDPAARRRYTVASISGRLFSSRAEDVGRGMDAARLEYGAAEGRSETEVARLFGPPQRTTRFEDVRVFWYVRPRDEVFALVFRQGRYVTAFRTDREEMERMLEKPSPYTAVRADYGLSAKPGTNLNEVTLAR